MAEANGWRQSQGQQVLQKNDWSLPVADKDDYWAGAGRKFPSPVISYLKLWPIWWAGKSGGMEYLRSAGRDQRLYGGSRVPVKGLQYLVWSPTLTLEWEYLLAFFK